MDKGKEQNAIDLDEGQIGGIEAGLAELNGGRILSHEDAEEKYRRLLMR